MKFPHELFWLVVLIILIVFHIVDYFYRVFILRNEKLRIWLWNLFTRIWRIVPIIVLAIIFVLLEQWIGSL
jgi:hypothetical protein